jgi:hypothetical protein
LFVVLNSGPVVQESHAPKMLWAVR